MVSEVLDHLFALSDARTSAHGVFVDGTVGAGGHAAALLRAAPHVTLLGIDRDPDILDAATKRLAPYADRVHLVHGSYADLQEHLAAHQLDAPRGVLLDVGVSSLQLDRAERGFSFSDPDALLDMRFDKTSNESTAHEVLNTMRERELADVFFHYGDERRSRALARAVVNGRPYQTVGELRKVAEPVVGNSRRHDPMTRIFQAIRIAVNDELGHLSRGLEAALQVLCPKGRLVVLAFHSGEERVVKQAFHEHRKQSGGTVLTRKPLHAQPEEIARNRRARPARLRAFEVAGDE